MFNIYVYYRVDACHEATAELPIRAMMAQMSCDGVTAQLMKKRDEPLLWMESYAGVADPESFSRELARAVDECELGLFINGVRHLECFACDPC